MSTDAVYASYKNLMMNKGAGKEALLAGDNEPDLKLGDEKYGNVCAKMS